jgi:S-layer homology domain
MQQALRRAVVCAWLLAATFVLVPAPPAAGEVRAVNTIHVTKYEDVVNPSDGLISLREAMTTADTDGMDTVVTLHPVETYVLDQCGGADNGTLIAGPDGSLTIEGLDPHASVEQTCAGAGVFDIDVGTDTFRLDNVTIAGGDRGVTINGHLGGGIGIEHADAVEIVDAIFEDNATAQVAGGGALYVNEGSVAIENSSFVGNESPTAGSAVVLRNRASITGAAFVGNHAGTGPAIFFDGGDVALTNSTIAGNSNDDATAAGITGTNDLEFTNVTLSGADPAQLALATSLTTAGSVFELTTAGSVCGIDPSDVTSLGNNWGTDLSCDLDAGTDIQGPGHDPLLRPVFRNGGPPSLYPEEDSPLLDSILASDSNLPDDDQRGVTRPQRPMGDIGSIEVAVCEDLFDDVDASNPFCWEIGWLSGSGVTTGFADGGYHPADRVTRQSMAAFMYRLAGSERGPSPNCTSAPFPDVPKTHPFCGEIDWLVDEGVTTGFADGKYHPNDVVSRQSMAAFMYRLAGSPNGDDPPCATPPFPDVPTTNTFCGEIDWLVDHGVTTGFADGKYHPTDPVTRQSMAAFLYRLAAGLITV